MSTILITGANKGLGRETARRLVNDGHDVWAGARDPERGRAAAEELGARPLVLDITDDASVNAAAKTVAAATGGALDVLINNAGISGGAMPIHEVTADHVQAVYDVNVFGAVRMLHAFLPLLEQSKSPVVVNVSSGLGSLTYSADPESPYSQLIVPAYFSSKAALNMLTIQYAHLHKPRRRPAQRRVRRIVEHRFVGRRYGAQGIPLTLMKSASESTVPILPSI